jgi:hypothetical protein
MTRANPIDKIIRFPARRSAVWLMRDGDAWLVLAGAHGWLHGDWSSAVADAQWMELNLGVPVRSTRRLPGGER